MSSNYLIGVGKYDITGPAAELGMMGMANLKQRTGGIYQRLFARAFNICHSDTNKRVVIVSTEIWSCTLAVKTEVVKRLQILYPDKTYSNDNVIISGTHTHSGPGGYSHYALYNLTIDGFYKQNFEVIVSGIVQAIDRSHKNVSPGKILIARGNLDKCGWNRSKQAYDNNLSVERAKYNEDTDKEMILLKFVGEDGVNIGSLNWFAIHPTSLGETNQLISGDNKGLAAYLLEKSVKKNSGNGNDFIAAFANSNCGDVSGNVVYDSSGNVKHDTDGNVVFDPPEGQHDFANMEKLGIRQYEKAKSLFDIATEELNGEIDYRHKFIDMSNTKIEGTQHRTFPSALGISMLAGSTEDSLSQFGIKEGVVKTADGNLPEYVEKPILILVKLLSAILDGANFPKELTPEFINGHGLKPIIIAIGLSEPFPMSAQVLPVQIIRIGNLALLGIPGEITTMSGRRLKETVLNKLKNIGVDYIALATYSNAYSSYITTKEEYDTQNYEGASTQFGPYTLMAYQQEFGKLADDMVNNKPTDRGPTPIDLSQHQISLQSGVVVDAAPFTYFGKVHKKAKQVYKPGQVVEVQFWGGHPKNNLRTEDTFLKIEKKDGNSWSTLYTDRDPEAIYIWTRKYFVCSLITIKWNIPADTEPGEYRVAHLGNSKNLFGKISEYKGVSKSFKVEK